VQFHVHAPASCMQLQLAHIDMGYDVTAAGKLFAEHSKKRIREEKNIPRSYDHYNLNRNGRPNSSQSSHFHLSSRSIPGCHEQRRTNKPIYLLISCIRNIPEKFTIERKHTLSPPAILSCPTPILISRLHKPGVSIE
jgi:hypothetical protein